MNGMRLTILRAATGLLLCLCARAGLRPTPLDHQVTLRTSSKPAALKIKKAAKCSKVQQSASSLRSLPLSAPPSSAPPWSAKAEAKPKCRKKSPVTELKTAQDVLDEALLDSMKLSQLQRRTVQRPSRQRYLRAWRKFTSAVKIKPGRLQLIRLDALMVTFFGVLNETQS